MAVACAALLGAFGASPVFAQVSGSVSASIQYDDNVFAQPDNVVPIGAPVQPDDEIAVITGNIDVRHKAGDIDLGLSGTASYSRYFNNTFYNNFNYAAHASVQRKPDRRIGFDLEVDSMRRLSSFADIFSIERNIQQYTSVQPKLLIPVTGEVVLVTKGNFRSGTNSATLIQANDFHTFGGGAGVGWYSPLGNVLELTVDYERTTGLSPRLVTVGGVVSDQPIDLTDLSVELLVKYAISPLTSIQADLFYARRRDHSLLAHDQDGPYGEITFDYHPRKTLRLTAKAGRLRQTQDSLYVDQVRDEYVSASGQVRVLDRLDLTAGAQIDWKHYFSRSSLALGATDFTETDYRYNVGAQYAISDRWLAQLQYNRYSRSSDLGRANYHANMIAFTLVRQFGPQPN